MVHESQGVNHPVMPAMPGAPQTVKPSPAGSFGRVLEEQSARAGVKFSAHANERLASRQINLSEDDLGRIGEAADKAAAKGSRESLFLLDKLGLIVNVRNRTVLTAIDPERMREGIVTNIDSTVILSKGK